MKEQRYSFKLSLTLALDEGWVVKSPPPPSPFTPGKETDTHCTGGWVGPRARFGLARNMSPQQGFNHRTVYPVASRYTDYAIPAHEVKRVWIN